VQSFKRTSVDQTSEKIRSFGMQELIKDVCFTLQHTLKNLPITVHIDCADDFYLVGLPGLMEQLLTNLIMNAVQHAFDHGKRAGNIHIAARRDGSQVQLSFADDGAGMPVDQLAHIFEPFFTTRRAEGGSGLGLYICYTIVTTQLGGDIVCKSRPNAGCRFDIRFTESPAPSPEEA
jgi:signal transduction histidine kinase